MRGCALVCVGLWLLAWHAGALVPETIKLKSELLQMQQGEQSLRDTIARLSQEAQQKRADVRYYIKHMVQMLYMQQQQQSVPLFHVKVLDILRRRFISKAIELQLHHIRQFSAQEAQKTIALEVLSQKKNMLYEALQQETEKKFIEQVAQTQGRFVYAPRVRKDDSAKRNASVVQAVYDEAWPW